MVFCTFVSFRGAPASTPDSSISTSPPPPPYNTSLKLDVLQGFIRALQVKELGIDTFEVSLHEGQRLTYVLQPVSYGSPQGRHH